MSNRELHANLTFEDFRQIVSHAAGVPMTQIETESDLVGLGLDSIRLMRLAGWLRKQGLSIRFSEFSDRQTVGEWWQLVSDVQDRIDLDETVHADTPVQLDESDPFDFAVMQHAFWVGRVEGQELSGVSAHFYNEFDADGEDVQGVDPQRLEQAVRELFCRHGMLRMRVTEDGRQRIDRQSSWSGLRVHDLRGLPEQERERNLRDIRNVLSHRIMDVAFGEVFDVQLSLLDGNATRMHVSLDMMAADAMSLRTLLKDLSTLYDGGIVQPSPLTYSYPRYLVERIPVRREARERAAAWWQEKLPTLSGPPNLSVLREEGLGGRPTVTRRCFWLSPEQKEEVLRLSRKNSLTPAAAFATAFAEVVARWSSTDRFLLNLPVFDREPLHEEVDLIVGDFSSSVLIDADMSGNVVFCDRAARVQSLLHEAIGHAEYTGVEVLRDLTRAAGGETVLAPVVFTSALDLGELFAPEVQKLFGCPSWIISQGPQVWLDAQVTELDGGLLINWDARDSVFPAGVLDAMFDAFEGLVNLLLENEGAWKVPAELPLPKEQREVRERVNDTALPLDQTPLHERFFGMAESSPRLPAVIWDCGQDNGSMTYGQLSLEARRVAAMLVANGIGKGSRVGITLPKGPGQIVAVFGILAAGAAYVPSGVDVPMLRRAKVFELSSIDAVLVNEESAGLAWPASLNVLRVGDAVGFKPLEGIVKVDPESEMYVLFTSGSTGEPKGVRVPHRAVANTICAVQKVFDVGSTDRTIALSALDFDLSVYDMFAFLATGGSVVALCEPQRRDALAWAELIKAHGVTIVSCVPALLDMLLVAGSEQLPQSALRLVMLGGDWVTVDLSGRLRSLVPGCRFAGLGGMTEAAIHTTVCEVKEVDPSWRSVPYGLPLANMRCRVVAANGRDCPDWVPGELWAAGAGVALGYDGDPERTAQRFVESESATWYRTGDLARYWPNGTLEFMGRMDDQVKIRGHRIELGEIETQLASHPDVKSAVAVVITQATRQIAAAAVLEEGASGDGLRQWLAERLPSYMVPERIQVLEAFPITSNGKIDRAAIRSGLCVDETPSISFKEPVGPAELAVAGLWRDLLGVDRIGRKDEFFALGGDSLLATRFMRRLRESRIVGASLSALFETPDLEGFSKTLSIKGLPESSVALSLLHQPEKRFEPFALTDVQRAYWIGRDPKLPLGGISPSYYLEFDGADVDLDKLTAAWNILVRRHDMLRVIVSEDGMQKVLAEVPDYAFDIVEADERLFDSAVENMREGLIRGKVDASLWPLFGIGVVRYGMDASEMRCRVGVMLDSIAFDGRSIMVLFTEWERLYLDAGELKPLGITFRDWMVQTPSNSVRREASLSYWFERVDKLPPAPQLPLVTDPSAIGSPRFQRHSAIVDVPVWDDIRMRAQGLGFTPTAVLLAVYAEVLAQWSGRSDMTINLTLFDREDIHPDINQVVGDFSSLMLVECNARGRDGFEASVRALQKQLWDDLDHRYVSGVRVLRELARKNGATLQTMPVVFTSVLGLGDDASLEFSEGFLQPVYGLTQTPQVYLDLKVSETSRGLSIDWDSVDELFAPGLGESMFEAYVELVRRLIAVDWSQGIASSIPTKQRAVRDSVNSTEGPAPESTLGKGLLHGGFFAQALIAPSRTALVAESEETSYGELANRALQVAAWISERGVEPGDTVAVDLPKGRDQVAALFGVLAAGATYLPIGRDLPSRRKTELVANGNAVLLIKDIGASAEYHPAPGPKPVDASQTAYVIFTSGTTGEPKGVEISHRSAVNTIDAINSDHRVGPGDRVLAVSGVEFDLSVYDVFGLLSLGGAIVSIIEDERRDAQRWLELTFEHGVTIWNTVPALLDMLVTVAETESGLPGSLRLAMVSGDWVPLDLPVRTRALAPQCEFVSLGGATEASIWSNAYHVENVNPNWVSIPYGFPLRNQSFRVVDERGRDCPDWVKGELWIGGLGVAQGYRGDAERTEERFVLCDSQRWYRTGDMGRYWSDGTLEFSGRLDTQVKVRGHRIELGEIEAALSSYPGIDRGVCVAPGERERRWLTAFVRGVDDLDDLKGFLSERLAPYAVPRQIVPVDSFPLTSNGKVDRASLVRHAGTMRGLGTQNPSEPRSSYEPPSSDVEKRVAEAWRDVLGADRVGRGDDFFSLGGDSLLATRLVSRLRAEGLADAELANLFLAPTLAGFSETLTNEAETALGTITPDRDNLYEPFDLTDVQQAYWIGRDPRLPLGGICAQFYVEYEHEAADAERLEDAWNRLLRRHEMLRSVVDADGCQRILESVPHYEIETIRASPDFEGMLAAHRERAFRNTSDPSTWPLFNIKMYSREDGSARLCVSLDNLIVDGLSALTLFDEWKRLFADPEDELDPIGLTFRDYAVQAKPSLERLKAAREYWGERLASLPSAPKLPLRVKPNEIERPTFIRREVTMDADTWRGITERASQHGVTPAVVLLTCYADVLSRWSGQRELTVNLTLFDRQPLHPNIDRVVGDFTSLLLVSYRAEGTDESWLTRARRVQEQLWRDLDHREVSGVVVMRELSRANDTPVDTMPIVFTSMLGVGKELMQQMRWPDYTRSQTPQVWLDHQVVEHADGMLLSWDSVDALFPERLVDDMFAEYRDEIMRLSSDDWQTAASPASFRPDVPDEAAIRGIPVGDELPEDQYESPSGEMEKVVADLWGELLDSCKVGRNDGFFALGGDSLLATRLITRLRYQGITGGRLALLLAGPTLAEFSETLSFGELQHPIAIQADQEHRYDPFPLTEVQEAYWLGRSDDFVLGGVPALFGIEREIDGSEIERIESAWNALVERHEMLRAVITPDGRQRILREVPRYRFPVIEVDAGEAGEAELARIREEMRGSTLNCLTWPLFDIRVIKRAGSVRLAVVFDTMVVDGASMLTLFSEWDKLAADPEEPLEPLLMSFRDYVVQGGPGKARLEKAEKYWFGRVGTLPPGPSLALAAEPDSIVEPAFQRLEYRLDPSSWQSMIGKAKRQDITPSVALLVCYAETLAEAAHQSALTVSLTLFDRPAAYPVADRIVGDFTSLVLVECELCRDDTLIGRLKRIQEQVWSDLDHREVSAMRVLRETASRGGRLAEAVPVVFTSMLGVDAGLSHEVRWPEEAWSQTPQVWLDHQVVETPDGVILTWDFVKGLFAPEAIEGMFETYIRKVKRLADTDWAIVPASVPQGASGSRPCPSMFEGESSASNAKAGASSTEPPREGIERELADLWENVVGSPPITRQSNFFASGGDSLNGTQLVQAVSKKYGASVSLRRFFDSPTIADLAEAVASELENVGPKTIGTI